MPYPVNVTLISDFQIHVLYDDGMEGDISIKKSLKQVSSGRKPNVIIDEVSKDILVDDEIHLCKDAIYRQLELKSLMKRLKLDLPG